METDNFEKTLRKIVAAAEEGSFQLASTYLSQTSQFDKSPILQSYRAYCMAGQTSDRRQLRKAAQLCQEAAQRDPSNSVHHLLMGRILLSMGDRKNAMRIFQSGLKIAPNAKIIAELKGFGTRKPAMFERLERTHPLNRYLGIFFSRLGVR